MTSRVPSTRKRKRQADHDESFRRSFLELRDSGVPDTGPKRPKDKRTIALTPAVATSSNVSSVKATQQETELTGKGQGAKGFSEKRGRGRRRTQSGVRSSRGRNTPRTQLRADIHDLIDSAIQRGDVTPAPPKTALTPHVSPHPTSQDDSVSSAVDHYTQEMELLSTKASVTDTENGMRIEIEANTHMTSGLESPAVVAETPSQSGPLRSVLKGVHSLSSLQKRSQVSHTPHSVTFREHITVTEYSPIKNPNNTDSSLDSSTSASPSSPLSSRTTGVAETSLEPLEENDEEEGGEGKEETEEVGEEVEEEVGEEREEEVGEDGEEEVGEEREEEVGEDGEEEEEMEEEEESVDVRMQTPHLLPKPPEMSFTSNSVKRSKKTASRVKPLRKTRHSRAEDSSGPPKTLSRTLIKNLFMLSGKRRVTTDAVDLILKFSEVYLKRCSQDLATYAGHAGRKTMEVDDAVLLLKRQRFINESETFEYLVNTYLPLEYVEELLPCAVAGRKIVPTRVK